MHGITGIDHPVIAVAEMERARRQYERLGFTVPPRGSHLEWGTGNWCIMFPDDYLELRGVIDATRHLHRLDDFLRARGEGMMGLALGTADAGASLASLRSCGLRVGPVQELTRNFELPICPVQPRFSVCFLEESETPGLGSVVLCQHRTPELIRSPEWLEHANTATRVVSVTAVVSQLDQAGASYRRLLGDDAVKTADGGFEIRVGMRGRIDVVTAMGLPVRHPGVVYAVPVEPPFPAAVTVEVRDLDAVRRTLSASGIAFRDRGAVRVGPEDACGVILEFVAGRV